MKDQGCYASCGSCGEGIASYQEVLAGQCIACQLKQQPIGCQCGDCLRKAGAENFEAPGAFARSEQVRHLLTRVQKCVECGTTMTSEQKLKSLACPKCVETLGTDEETGRWDGKPEPSEDEKKGAA